MIVIPSGDPRAQDLSPTVESRLLCFQCSQTNRVGCLDVLAAATCGAPYIFSHPPALRARVMIERHRIGGRKCRGERKVPGPRMARKFHTATYGACLFECVSWSPQRTSAGGLHPPAQFALGHPGWTTTISATLSHHVSHLTWTGGPHWETGERQSSSSSSLPQTPLLRHEHACVHRRL